MPTVRPIPIMAEDDPARERSWVPWDAAIVPVSWLPLGWDLRAPLMPRLTARPLAAIQRDIDRATVPAMRREDV